MLIYPEILEHRFDNEQFRAAKKKNIFSLIIRYHQECTHIENEKYLIDGHLFTVTDHQCIIHTPKNPRPLFVYKKESIIIISSRQKYFQYFDDLLLTPISKAEFLLQNWDSKRSSFFEEIKKIAYGSTLKIDFQKHEYVYTATDNYATTSWQGTLEEAKEHLYHLLQKHTACSHTSIAVPISGGIDSATIAALLYEQTHPVFSYTIGTEEGNEYKGAAANANYIGTRHKEVFIDNEEYMQIFEHCIALQEFMDVRYAEGFVGFYKVYESATHDTINHIYTGYGADLILGDIFGLDDKSSCNDIAQKALLRTNYTGEMDDGIATHFQCQLHHPFLHEEVIAFALGIPWQYKLHNNQVKYILRQLLSDRKLLPESIIKHPKVAFTHGTAFDIVFAKMLKINPDDYTAKQLFLYDRLYSLLFKNHI